MIELPEITDEEVREAAILLAASDAVRCDHIVPAARALAFTQGWWDAVDREPYWRDGGHMGDCTNDAMTCGRCLCEDYEDQIRAREAGVDFDTETSPRTSNQVPDVGLAVLPEETP